MIPMNVCACSAVTLPKPGAGTMGSFGLRTRPSVSARETSGEDVVQDVEDVAKDLGTIGSVAGHGLDRSTVELDGYRVVLHVRTARRREVLLLQSRECRVAHQVVQPLEHSGLDLLLRGAR